MTIPDLHAFYQSRKAAFEEQLLGVSRRIDLVSHARLLTALLFIGAAYIGLTIHAILYAAVAMLLLFVWLIRHHARLFEEKMHLQNLVKLNDAEARAARGDFSKFSTGAQYIDPHHPYTHDLDIFGDGSLFQAVNRCNTLSGEKLFAERLANPLTTPNEIRRHQEAIRDLTRRTDFRQHFQAAGMEAGEQPGDRIQLQAWLSQKPFLYPRKIYAVVLVGLPAVTVASVLAAWFIPVFKTLAIFFAIVQWIIIGLHVRRVNLFHDYISRKKNILQKFAKLLDVLQAESFDTPLLNEIRGAAAEAGAKVRSLASLVSALDARLNSMTMLVMNSLLLYDLQCVYRLERWKALNGVRLNEWLQAVAETEVLCSLGTFAFNHPAYTDAVLHDDRVVDAVGMGHPLLPDDERVDNDIALGKPQRILIITGANMAGKSTFLRTLGTNIVLAQNGAPVCAKSFRCPVIPLLTGMRTADSLKDHQSYFYAELDRLKAMMDKLRTGQPALILLDEILKGTNSTDKQAGSLSLVKQLVQQPCLVIIATHDLALGDLEKIYPADVKNYSFEANIENDQLSFDYKLKKGTAQKMNATFLMKKMGIIPNT